MFVMAPDLASEPELIFENLTRASFGARAEANILEIPEPELIFSDLKHGL